MKILHLSPQNYTGILTLFVQGHRALGHESRLVTFYRAKNRYPEDICLNLPFVGPMEWLWKVKRLIRSGSLRVPFTGTTNRIFWKPSGAERILMPLRDLLWSPFVKRAYRKYGFSDFDIHVLEGGMSFFRDGRDVKKLRAAGKHIVSNYHGLDLRMRGAIKPVWDVTELHTTCEFDLFQRYDELEYLFLPFDSSLVPPANPSGEIIKICHAPRIRSVKGTDTIIKVVEKLSETLPVEMVLIENMPHQEALRLKSQCHIAIDQIASGDMGYGVNSLESLAMGVCTVTNLSQAYQDFIPDHPFALAEPHDLEAVLRRLILDGQLRERYAASGPGWIRKTHHWKTVASQMHARYAELGWAE
ncbi:MAG: glycosyltransferase [Candidatus Fermentibacteraceae bacterium]|nr:glycosyltransferase [Candidatus Fermentibacteraceae bacterium]